MILYVVSRKQMERERMRIVHHGKQPNRARSSTYTHKNSFINVCINNVLLCMSVRCSGYVFGFCLEPQIQTKNNHDGRWRLITIVLLENIWGEK